MGEKILMKGNEVIAEAALRAGCRHYFGYPITPQTEVAHYMARKMEEIGGTFVQAESEVAAINMVYGAASAGVRAMTSSSSPGISLKQEGISYAAGAELPLVVIDIVRCGPGLGGILPAQCDYFQMVKGGGHGDYHNIVLAPQGVQEMYELVVDAFNLADKYRNPVVVMGDGYMGQMMEAVEFRDEEKIERVAKPWAACGSEMKRPHNTITSIYIEADVLEAHVNHMYEKYREIERTEARVECFNCDGADVIIAAYGTCARVTRNVIKDAAKLGVKVGLIRPITLWPFPKAAFEKYAEVPKGFLTVEMSMGQMVEDIKLALNGRNHVSFYGRTGGNVPGQKDILGEVLKIARGEGGAEK
ncbi:MAG: 3-methyl-2-oxobutanoate dehydrogenase subunit VorB [Clostridia bacterium]|nr:3-methyl-2-oxobutanoate dehydrogenase subunit VorB [Clostridia bacterium]